MHSTLVMRISISLLEILHLLLDMTDIGDRSPYLALHSVLVVRLPSGQITRRVCGIAGFLVVSLGLFIFFYCIPGPRHWILVGW
jgi:hypothetical protein